MKLNIDDLGVVGIVVDDWDINKSFKPKTITTDYSSWIAYISRRPVPAGIPITDTYYWKPLTRLQVDLALDYNNFKENIIKEFERLKQIVVSFLKSSESGVAVTDSFGSSKLIAVSQYTQTNAFNKIWQYLEDKFGEMLQGINMIVTPTYFIGEEAIIRITANSVEANGIFEKISFYWNDEDENETEEHTTAFYTAENVPSITPYIEVDVPMDKVNPITNKIKIKCIAQIMGLTYTREQFVTHCSEFWLGASTSYLDIINAGDRYTIPITNGMRGSYDITVEDGQSIIIIVSKSLREGFIRADLNSVEIPFTEIMLTSEYNETLNETEAEYIAFVSSPWIAGTYNIDING